MGDKFERQGDIGGFAEETRMVCVDNVRPSGAGPMGHIKVDPLPAGATPRLEISAGPERGKVQRMSKPLVILGRVDDVADVVVPNNTASRHHAAIAYTGGAFILYDMGSTNGTLVNGVRVTEQAIDHGDEIEIGDNVFTFWLD